MLKYKNSGNCITINLQNNYSIVVTYLLTKENRYYVSMYLRDDTVEDLRLINTQYLLSERENVKTNICKLIEIMLFDKEIDNCIKKYEYEIRCFEVGNKVLSK